MTRNLTTAPRHVYMVERADEPGQYRNAPRSEINRMTEAGTIRFEGVDGDEYRNLVTYWFTRDVEDR